eukprot:Rhum_TRINITY_DN23090_c0_g1::Rhum_TRINITY_DN23090_c0_g1_i1::g.177091::m.177091/K12447/USP; UDP-sugar pyrophosphorylase
MADCVQRGKDVVSELDQAWLTEKFDAAASPEVQAKQDAFYEQLGRLDGQYPGGLRQYVANAKRLLEESKAGVNPYEGRAPEVPSGLSVDYGSEEFLRLEKVGLAEVRTCCFVLVAGGLGERLGYNGIKLSLEVESVSEASSYLRYYVDNIKALEEASGASSPVPLAIMTSGDTHEKTVALLEANSYFGRPEGSITLMKQEKVPSISDNNGRFVKEDEYTLETKPHGHGDVHQLLHMTGTAQKWAAAGKKWVLFLQDTNAMVFNTSQAALGLSKERGFLMNSICIARKAGEAIGAIARLVKQDGSAPPLTISVEYNQLGPLLKDFNGEGDVADASGCSPYPGNINTLVFSLPQYVAQLEKTKGLIAEFVNPKYADAEKLSFKKPTRLECMMQDYPKTLSDEDASAVGFTTFERLMAFSPVKNNVVDAAAKAAGGLDAHSAASAEADFYESQCQKLSLCGASIEKAASPTTYLGVPVTWSPRVFLHPSFAPTQAALAEKVTPPTPSSITLSARSTLVVEGKDVVIKSLHLDGALIIKAADGVRVVIDGLRVVNKGWEFVDSAPDAPEHVAIRGYTVRKHEERSLVYNTPGEYTVSE